MTMTDPRRLTRAADRARRPQIADESQHNSEFAGLVADAAYEAYSIDWAEGRMPLEELIARTRERYLMFR
jgi:hypothetical protein